MEKSLMEKRFQEAVSRQRKLESIVKELDDELAYAQKMKLVALAKLVSVRLERNRGFLKDARALSDELEKASGALPLSQRDASSLDVTKAGR